ncbi:MAG TPA: PLP-dependent aminotransferase family protein [Acidimicrobiales bacterium]
MKSDGTIVSARLVELLRPWLGAGPAYQGVATGLRSLILDGRLPIGSRIPSERVFSSELHMGRITVSSAYDILRFEGYLSSAGGAGTRVTLPANAPVRPDRVRDGQHDRWDLTVAALPAPPALVEALASASEDIHPYLAGHGLHPMGLPELREAVAAHLSKRGLVTSFDQVLITNGALQAWHILLQAFTTPGDRVVVEQPTYPAVLDAIGTHRRRTVALPVSAGGWEQVSETATRLAHVTPDGQNPTGFVADNDQRKRLVRALKSDVIVTDETFADLLLDGSPARPLGTFDSRVVTVGSMSKAFWSGLRIGWIRADREVIAQLALARAMTDTASPLLEQLVATWLLRHADDVLPERCSSVRRNRDALTKSLSSQLPNWRYHLPAAGLFLWVELPEPGATRVASYALDVGLRLTPGPRFMIDGTADRWLRLPFILPPDEVDKMVSVLSHSASQTGSKPRSSRVQSRWTV